VPKSIFEGFARLSKLAPVEPKVANVRFASHKSWMSRALPAYCGRGSVPNSSFQGAGSALQNGS